MAKRKVVDTTPKYYVYYDNKTGRICSVGNERNNEYEHGIEVPFEDVENLISGVWKFSDYQVGYKRSKSGSAVLGIIVSGDQDNPFRSNAFECITQTSTDSDCIVEWNKVEQAWKIKLSSKFRSTYNSNMLLTKLFFFVTLEGDFDFLVRTITIDMESLLDKDIVIPFESSMEQQIDKISISTKLVFKTYGLRVINE